MAVRRTSSVQAAVAVQAEAAVSESVVEEKEQEKENDNVVSAPHAEPEEVREAPEQAPAAQAVKEALVSVVDNVVDSALADAFSAAPVQPVDLIREASPAEPSDAEPSHAEVALSDGGVSHVQSAAWAASSLSSDSSHLSVSAPLVFDLVPSSIESGADQSLVREHLNQSMANQLQRIELELRALRAERSNEAQRQQQLAEGVQRVQTACIQADLLTCICIFSLLSSSSGGRARATFAPRGSHRHCVINIFLFFSGWRDRRFASSHRVATRATRPARRLVGGGAAQDPGAAHDGRLYAGESRSIRSHVAIFFIAEFTFHFSGKCVASGRAARRAPSCGRRGARRRRPSCQSGFTKSFLCTLQGKEFNCFWFQLSASLNTAVCASLIGAVERELKQCFRDALIPGFQSSAQKMFAQVPCRSASIIILNV